MTGSVDILRAKLNAETGKLVWNELERHFARGVVIKVAGDLDLLMWLWPWLGTTSLPCRTGLLKTASPVPPVKMRWFGIKSRVSSGLWWRRPGY